MKNQQDTYNQSPQMEAPMMPPQGHPIRRAPQNWKQRFLSVNTGRPLTPRQERTIPGWLTGKSVTFFFLAMFACWIIFGFIPDMDLVIVSCISVLIFFYGSISLSRQGAGLTGKAVSTQPI